VYFGAVPNDEKQVRQSVSLPARLASRVKTLARTQGESIEEAIANLREATELYLEEFPLPNIGQPLITTFQIAGHA
jgi:hypothetical protein